MWPSRVDKRIFADDFVNVLLEKWKIDALGYASAKMSRRIVGLAKTSDIETLEPNLRVGAARGVLRSAQMIIRERAISTDISHITGKVLAILNEVKTK